MRLSEKLGLEYPFMDACAIITLIALLLGVFNPRIGACLSYAFDHVWWAAIPMGVIGFLGIAWIVWGIFCLSLALFDWLK